MTAMRRIQVFDGEGDCVLNIYVRAEDAPLLTAFLEPLDVGDVYDDPPIGLSASPDLSIDREGLALAMYAEAMGCTDAEAREWWADDSPAANQRELRKADRLLARYAALRGTSQQEPTE